METIGSEGLKFFDSWFAALKYFYKPFSSIPWNRSLQTVFALEQIVTSLRHNSAS
jgi:hypothetical protein